MVISGIKTFTFSLRDHQNPFARFATEPLIQPVRGFKTMKTAYATIKGFEVMRALRKGQLGLFSFEGGIVGKATLIERAFGMGPCALSVAVALIRDRLAGAES